MGSVFGWPDLNTLGSDDLRWERGGTPFPYYLCSGNAVPFEKNQGWWNVVPEQDKNGGTLFPVTAIKQVKTNQAVGRRFL